MTLVFLVRSPNHMVEGLMLIMRSGVPSGAKEPHGSLFALNNSSSCHKQKIMTPRRSAAEWCTLSGTGSVTCLGVPAGVDLCCSVCGHVIQDFWHLSEHFQAVHMDLHQDPRDLNHDLKIQHLTRLPTYLI